MVLGEETLGGVRQHQICWGGVGSKGEGETKTRGCCVGKLVVRITFGGGWGGMGFGEGGVKEMQVHTGDEKTTKRWEADDRARDRLKKDG